MNDLISRTSLLKTLNDWWLSETPNGRVLFIGGELQRTPAMKDIEQFMIAVENAPTAYDPDKVVEQLEKEKGIAFVTLANTGNKELDFTYQNVVAYMDKAIEIVKGGNV